MSAIFVEFPPSERTRPSHLDEARDLSAEQRKTLKRLLENELAKRQAKTR